MGPAGWVFLIEKIDVDRPGGGGSIFSFPE
jgi:hypothetical protein